MLSQIFIIAVVCVTATKILTDLYKKFWDKKYAPVMALIISLMCAFAFNLGLIEALCEFLKVPILLVGWLGMTAHIVDLTLTGAIYTKGANKIHDIIGQLQMKKEGE
jgi:hypothetical protein